MKLWLVKLFSCKFFGLRKMLRTDTYFNVCTIQDCAKVGQVCIAKERMNVYSAIHCMNWYDMLPDYRQMIVAMVLDDFRGVLTD
jgi:hypothetical protein